MKSAVFANRNSHALKALFLTLVIGASSPALLRAQGLVPKADLVPVTQTGGWLAIRWDNEANPGVYHFKVKNNGLRTSAQTVTRITVANRQGQIVQTIPVTTPEIAPGATASLSFNYPGNVCYVTMTAICDFGRVVAESNENNNTAKLTITCED